MRIAPILVPTLLATALLSACAGMGAGSGPRGTALLEARSGSTVAGKIALHDTPAGLSLKGEVRGLAPGSVHGFHVHEKGDCSAPDATSAGGHFNPAGAAHGSVASAVHHAGDMPNIQADSRGVATVDVTIAGDTLAGGAQSVAGRSLVVHRDADDYTSQPAGNAGPRVACGVITLK
jgi:Cu-Zn family superoxide dismutase